MPNNARVSGGGVRTAPPAPQAPAPNMRGASPMGGFASPSAHPNAFQGQMRNHFEQLAGQLGTGPKRGNMVGLPDFGPQPGSQTRPPRFGTDPGPAVTPDPGNQGGAVGPQGFGTYAPGVEDSQFTRENFQRQGFKGREGNVTQLDGGMGGFGGMGYGSMGGMGMMGGMGGIDPAMLSMIQALLGQFGGGRGTLVGN